MHFVNLGFHCQTAVYFAVRNRYTQLQGLEGVLLGERT